MQNRSLSIDIRVHLSGYPLELNIANLTFVPWLLCTYRKEYGYDITIW